jgi:hypothetical protein
VPSEGHGEIEHWISRVMPDLQPPPLGDTDRSRYVKVRTVEETHSTEIAGSVEQAAGVHGWK